MVRRWFCIRLVFPLMLFVRKFLSDPAGEKLEGWLLEMNNRLIKSFPGRSFRKILLLLPHCIQFDECPHRITGSISNCKKCGKCPISDLLTLGEKCNIIMKVATGGRLAKRIVKEAAPDLVLAVACERELCEGICGVYPMPVYAVVNIRKSGPCVNTTVDIDLVEKALKDTLVD